MKYIISIPYDGDPGLATEVQRKLLYRLTNAQDSNGAQKLTRLGREMYGGNKSSMLWEIYIDPFIAFVLTGEYSIKILAQNQ